MRAPSGSSYVVGTGGTGRHTAQSSEPRRQPALKSRSTERRWSRLPRREEAWSSSDGTLMHSRQPRRGEDPSPRLALRTTTVCGLSASVRVKPRKVSSRDARDRHRECGGGSDGARWNAEDQPHRAGAEGAARWIVGGSVDVLVAVACGRRSQEAGVECIPDEQRPKAPGPPPGRSESSEDPPS